jgi:hypothetical protein
MTEEPKKIDFGVTKALLPFLKLSIKSQPKQARSIITKVAEKKSTSVREAKIIILSEILKLTSIEIKRFFKKIEKRKGPVAVEWSIGPVIAMLLKIPLLTGGMYGVYIAAGIAGAIPNLIKRKKPELEKIMKAIDMVSPTAPARAELLRIQKLIASLLIISAVF